MPLDPKSSNIHYLVGRLCGAIYPDSVSCIPPNITAQCLRDPVKGLGMLTLPNTPAVAEIMDAMPADPPRFDGGADIKLQGDFWLGYYHQRSSTKRARTFTPDLLQRAGETLFGERWQTDMANALGLGDSARIRQMLTGRRPVPPGIAATVVAMLRQASEASRVLADEIDADNNPQGR